MGGGAQTGAIVPYNPSANQPVQTGWLPRQDRQHGSDVRFGSGLPEGRQSIP